MTDESIKASVTLFQRQKQNSDKTGPPVPQVQVLAHAVPLTEVFYARCLLLTQLMFSSLPETVLWEGVLGSLSGCTSAPSMPVPQDLDLDDGAVSGFISQHFQSLMERTDSHGRVPVCLISLQPLRLPHPSLHSLCVHLQPKLKPLSEGFNSDYSRYAGKWTLMSGDQTKAYNKGSPSGGQQQCEKVEHTE